MAGFGLVFPVLSHFLWWQWGRASQHWGLCTFPPLPGDLRGPGPECQGTCIDKVAAQPLDRVLWRFPGRGRDCLLFAVI